MVVTLRKLAFVVKAQSAWTGPVRARGLASAGRIDVVARSLMAALSQPLRKSTLFASVLEGPPSPPLTLIADGAEASPPRSEREFAELYNTLLASRKVAGYAVTKLGFEKLVRELEEAGYAVYYLHERGDDIRRVNIQFPAAFILGDHIGLDRAAERFLEAHGVPRVSLGPIPYFTSHCIILVCEEVARRNCC